MPHGKRVDRRNCRQGQGRSKGSDDNKVFADHTPAHQQAEIIIFVKLMALLIARRVAWLTRQVG